MHKVISWIKNQPVAIMVFNLLLAMFVYTLCRCTFWYVNSNVFGNIATNQLLREFCAGLKFDLTAVLYTNLIYFAMMVMPFAFRHNAVYQSVAKWVFCVVNSISVISNLSDAVYFPFSGRRSTVTIFSEFSNDSNIASVCFTAACQNWYLIIIGALFIALLVVAARKVEAEPTQEKKHAVYYVTHTATMLLAIYLLVCGARGGFTRDVRPISLNNANAYVDKPIESAIVLNTPFCVLRTIGNTVYKNPNYYTDYQSMSAVFEPVIYPDTTKQFRPMNVVVLILESFSKEFFASLNKDADNGEYKGFTPFLDSIVENGLTFEHTFANGRKSIDAMPSILSSIPRFYEPYFTSPYSNNRVSGIAGELNNKGYQTAFFHGAPNGSMGFEAFANISGFKEYYGMTEYGNRSDFDGHWAIWDEEFLQFYANTMATFAEPFMTAIFTASSHHPFRIPTRYADVYPEDGIHPLHKCIRYCDMGLRRFFENASQQPWFENTLFVITADHTNGLTRPEYNTDAGYYKVPIIFYTPNGDLRGHVNTIAQQIDIMPTILGYLNYDKPYVAFGHNLLDTVNYQNHYAVNYNNGIVQYFTDSLMLLYNDANMRAAYNFIGDQLLQTDIKQQLPDSVILASTKHMQAILQQYIERMIANNLTIETK